MIINSRLAIVFETGVDPNGEPIFRTKSFNNIKEEATNTQLKAIADALIPLQSYSVAKIERNNQYDLTI